MAHFIEQDLYFDSKSEFEEARKSFRLLGQGGEGHCYQFNKNYVFKLFRDDIIGFMNQSELLQFKNVQSKLLHFNRGSLYISNDFKGVTMEYAIGKTMNKIIRSVPFDILINACKVYEEEMRLISEQGIKVWDIYYVNTLWNNDKFEVIDANNSKFSSEKNLYEHNISYLPNNLLISLFVFDYIRLIKKKIILGDIVVVKRLKDGLSDEFIAELKRGVKITPSELMERIKQEVQSSFGNNINCIQDTFELVKKI